MEYPHHWIFDYQKDFMPKEWEVVLLLFSGKKTREIAKTTGLTWGEVEAVYLAVGHRTHLGHSIMNRSGIESGRFFRKWGFTWWNEPDPMDDPAF